MKKTLFILSVFLAFVFWSSCNKIPKRTDWKPAYTTKSKQPFGFNLFKRALPLIFPDANIQEVGINSSIFSNIDYDKNSAFIILASNIDFSDAELNQLNHWLNYGNDVVIISEGFGEGLSEFIGYDSALILKGTENPITEFLNIPNNESSKEKILKVITNHTSQKTKANYKFSIYKFNPFELSFAFNEKSKTYKKLITESNIISQLDNKDFNALSFQVGEGNLILVTSPLAFSNYYMLQENNIQYFSDILSFTNENISKVYFAVGTQREKHVSDWGILWKHKATRTALLIAIFALIIYALINLKRRQNIIPVMEPLTNDSKSFVETIANLYYLKHNNKNMALKMIQHFLEHVRSNYKLNTSILDKEFGLKLATRTANTEADTNALMYQIKSILDNTIIVDDKQLFKLHANIQKFLKK
ncbi:MAG TPA: DUF4350 domain-containing protein [Edaphocola sp.]|nr:DUF4350 domain-containing protein [Edaphocola sp.]